MTAEHSFTCAGKKVGAVDVAAISGVVVRGIRKLGNAGGGAAAIGSGFTDCDAVGLVGPLANSGSAEVPIRLVEGDTSDMSTTCCGGAGTVDDTGAPCRPGEASGDWCVPTLLFGAEPVLRSFFSHLTHERLT